MGDGRGPRHMALLPERGLALVVCELQNYVQVGCDWSRAGHVTWTLTSDW